MSLPIAQKDSIALSLGVSLYSPWDLDMANRGFMVLQYDGSIEKQPYHHKNIKFFKKFISNSDSNNTITIQTIINQNNFNTNSNNIMQVDIEDNEWDILENIEVELLAKYFTQVIFEFHNCDVEDEMLSTRRFRILEKINKHFTPIHTHFNNYGKIFYADGLFLSSVFEVSYINNNLIETYDYKSGFCTIAGLDSPNGEQFGEIPVIFK